MCLISRSGHILAVSFGLASALVLGAVRWGSPELKRVFNSSLKEQSKDED